MSVLGKRWPCHCGKAMCSWRALPWWGRRDRESRPPTIALWHTICDRRYNIIHHHIESKPAFQFSLPDETYPLSYLTFLGSEKRVDGCFLKRWTEAEEGRHLRRKRRGRCVHCGSFITDCGHIDQVDWFTVMMYVVSKLSKSSCFCSCFWPKVSAMRAIIMSLSNWCSVRKG